MIERFGKTGGVAFAVILLFFISFAGAADTPIKVKTLPNTKTQVYVLDADQVYFLLESFYKTSDAQGVVAVVHSGTKSKLNVRVIVKDETGKNLVSEKFGPYTVANPISILALPDKLDGNYKEPSAAPPVQTPPIVQKNDTPPGNLVNPVRNNTSANKTKVSDFAIGNLNGTVSIIIAIVIALILLAGSFFAGLKFQERRMIKGNTLVHSDKTLAKKLKYTESQLEEAQSEINRLKNKDKIVEMERKIEEERKELDKLRKGNK